MNIPFSKKWKPAEGLNTEGMDIGNFQNSIVKLIHDNCGYGKLDDASDIYPSELCDINGKRHPGIRLSNAGRRFDLFVTLDSYWKEACKGRGLEDIVEDIAARFRAMTDAGYGNEYIEDYSLISKYIMVMLIGRDRNQRLLEMAPHEPLLDLEMVYCILLPGEAMVLVGNELLSIWGISKEELKDAALRNAQKKEPYVFRLAVEQFRLETPLEEIRNIPSHRLKK